MAAAARILKAFAICVLLSLALGLGLQLLLVHSFFDSRTRATVLACLGLLFLAVWCAFIAELREMALEQRAARAAEAARLEQEQQLEQEALRQAARLLSGQADEAPEELPLP
ncbi:MAG: hypothetical protein IIV90_06880 [Oscillospiraceae bacterium]|nr:hypothetical protein [Oscillospiraceae bacterium]